MPIPVFVPTEDQIGSLPAGTELTSEYHVAGVPTDGAGIAGCVAERLNTMSTLSPLFATGDHVKPALIGLRVDRVKSLPTIKAK